MLITYGDFLALLVQFIRFGEMLLGEFLSRLLMRVNDRYFIGDPLLGLAKSIYIRQTNVMQLILS